jgi:hypothetical protein
MPEPKSLSEFAAKYLGATKKASRYSDVRKKKKP